MVRREVVSHPSVEICPQCKQAFKNIAQHWQTHSFCNHPSYTETQKAATISLLMYRGYLQQSGGNSNASLVCFFEDQSLTEELFEIYGPLARNILYIDGVEFFGQPIQRSYALFIRPHPYLTRAAEGWGTGRSKFNLDPSQITDTSEITYALLYRLAGYRGFDGHDWPVFDCSQLDVQPHFLRELLSEYDSFVATDTYSKVVLKDSVLFFEDIEKVQI